MHGRTLFASMQCDLCSECVFRGRWFYYRVDEGGEPLELLEVCGAELGEFLFACFGQGEAHDAAVVAVFAMAGDEAELLGAIDELYGAVVASA
jgi:hypothetical protein